MRSEVVPIERTASNFSNVPRRNNFNYGQDAKDIGFESGSQEGGLAGVAIAAGRPFHRIVISKARQSTLKNP
ncbi:hypothetical protein TNCT_465511 [Trichonephila clavata]|uniref:Uncharacterized protein n=1 Tax=Trichonephila clavata TaxID=2740835 RepID=A0A8X6KNL3_TRICU|nr:hypothetical protein TNCT_465511 [Trichonephila clavata]